MFVVSVVVVVFIIVVVFISVIVVVVVIIAKMSRRPQAANELLTFGPDWQTGSSALEPCGNKP